MTLVRRQIVAGLPQKPRERTGKDSHTLREGVSVAKKKRAKPARRRAKAAKGARRRTAKRRKSSVRRRVVRRTVAKAKRKRTRKVVHTPYQIPAETRYPASEPAPYAPVPPSSQTWFPTK